MIQLIVKYKNIIMAAILLLCLFDMPYGYYNLVRYIAMIVFGIYAYKYYTKKKETLAIIFGALAVLFQPFAKIRLGREVWGVVDFAVAAFLVYLFVREKKRSDNDNKDDSSVI